MSRVTTSGHSDCIAAQVYTSTANTPCHVGGQPRQKTKGLRGAVGRALLPACFYQVFVAGRQLRQVFMIPLGRVGHGGPHQTLAGGDLMQQSVVVYAIIRFSACPQLPQHHPKGVDIHLLRQQLVGAFSRVAV